MSKLPDFFGLDIGNHTIKVCQIRRDGSTATLLAIGNHETPYGVMGSENEDHQQQLAKTIKAAVDDANIKTKNVVAALPESAIFTRLIPGFPKLPPDQLSEAILYESKKYIPIPPDETNMDHIVVGERKINGEEKLDILIVAASKNLVERYLKILKIAGLEPLALETESIATARAIAFNRNKANDSAIILDFGANGTDLSVIKGENLLFSQSLGTGSDALTRAIATDFGLATNQAEQYKRAYGLDDTQADGKIAKSLNPIMQVIVTEISKTIDFFKSRFAEAVPSKIYIVGDGGKLPGLPKYLNKALNIEATLASPFHYLKVNSKLENEIKQYSEVGFSVSAGLALKQE